MRPHNAKPVADRIRANVRRTKSGCWIWLGAKLHDGYGLITVGSRTNGTRISRRVHRVAYEIFIGSLPRRLLVCHSCDTPLCVNPEHLFLGTHKDNHQDRERKGRHPHSSEAGRKSLVGRIRDTRGRFTSITVGT